MIRIEARKCTTNVRVYWSDREGRQLVEAAWLDAAIAANLKELGL